jgi:hypothetical protein
LLSLSLSFAALFLLSLSSLLDLILEGKYDNILTKVISIFRAYSTSQFYLRIGYEFDLLENHYDSSSYRKVFQKIVRLFRSNHINNVLFIWHSTGSTIAADSVYRYDEWFPGREYVDMCGVSIFQQPYHCVYPTPEPSEKPSFSPLMASNKQKTSNGNNGMMRSRSHRRALSSSSSSIASSKEREREALLAASSQKKKEMANDIATLSHSHHHDDKDDDSSDVDDADNDAASKEYCHMPAVEAFTDYCSSRNISMMIAESSPFGGINTKNKGKNEAGYQGDTWEKWFVPTMDYIVHNDVRVWSYINNDWDMFPMWQTTDTTSPAKPASTEKVAATTSSKRKDDKEKDNKKDSKDSKKEKEETIHWGDSRIEGKNLLCVCHVCSTFFFLLSLALSL